MDEIIEESRQGDVADPLLSDEARKARVSKSFSKPFGAIPSEKSQA